MEDIPTIENAENLGGDNNINIVNNNKNLNQKPNKKILLIALMGATLLIIAMVCIFVFVIPKSNDAKNESVSSESPEISDDISSDPHDTPTDEEDLEPTHEQSEESHVEPEEEWTYERYYTGDLATYEKMLYRYARFYNYNHVLSKYNIFKKGLSDSTFRINATREYILDNLPSDITSDEMLKTRVSYKQLNDNYHYLFGNKDNISKGINAEWCSDFTLAYDKNNDNYFWIESGCGGSGPGYGFPKSFYLISNSSISGDKLTLEVLYSDVQFIMSENSEEDDAYVVGYDKKTTSFDMNTYGRSANLFFYEGITDKVLADWILNHKDYFTKYSLTFAKSDNHYYLESISKM